MLNETSKLSVIKHVRKYILKGFCVLLLPFKERLGMRLTMHQNLTEYY